jgi:hypothetical protein
MTFSCRLNFARFVLCKYKDPDRLNHTTKPEHPHYKRRAVDTKHPKPFLFDNAKCP